MTKNLSVKWSDSLQQQTRNAIKQIPITPDGNLHFKHATQGYAYATTIELCQDILILHTKIDDKAHQFNNVDDLLHAGWAID